MPSLRRSRRLDPVRPDPSRLRTRVHRPLHAEKVEVCPGCMESTVAETDVAAPCPAPLHPQTRADLTLGLPYPPGSRHLPPPAAAIRVERDGSARRIGLRHGLVAVTGLGQDLVGRDGEIRLVGVGGPVALRAGDQMIACALNSPSLAGSPCRAAVEPVGKAAGPSAGGSANRSIVLLGQFVRSWC